MKIHIKSLVPPMLIIPGILFRKNNTGIDAIPFSLYSL